MSAWSDEAGRIVETAFAAAVDDALWATLTEEVIAATGAAGSFLGILDHTTGYAARCVLTNANGRAYEEYMGGMSVLDPQARKVAMVDRAGVYTCQDHVDWDDPTTADYMKWQEDRLGWHGHVTVAMKLDERHACGMSCFQFRTVHDSYSSPRRTRAHNLGADARRLRHRRLRHAAAAAAAGAGGVRLSRWLFGPCLALPRAPRPMRRGGGIGGGRGRRPLRPTRPGRLR